MNSIEYEVILCYNFVYANSLQKILYSEIDIVKKYRILRFIIRKININNFNKWIRKRKRTYYLHFIKNNSIQFILK